MSGYSEELQTGWKIPAPGSEKKKIKYEKKERTPHKHIPTNEPVFK